MGATESEDSACEAERAKAASVPQLAPHRPSPRGVWGACLSRTPSESVIGGAFGSGVFGHIVLYTVWLLSDFGSELPWCLIALCNPRLPSAMGIRVRRWSFACGSSWDPTLHSRGCGWGTCP